MPALHDFLDVCDTTARWLPARVTAVADSRIKITYEGWSAKWDEWIPLDSPRLAPFRTFTKPTGHYSPHIMALPSATAASGLACPPSSSAAAVPSPSFAIAMAARAIDRAHTTGADFMLGDTQRDTVTAVPTTATQSQPEAPEWAPATGWPDDSGAMPSGIQDFSSDDSDGGHDCEPAQVDDDRSMRSTRSAAATYMCDMSGRLSLDVVLDGAKVGRLRVAMAPRQRLGQLRRQLAHHLEHLPTLVLLMHRGRVLDAERYDSNSLEQMGIANHDRIDVLVLE